MDNLEFQQESYASCIEEMMPLVERHYDELSRDKDIPLDPRHDRYKQLDENELIKLYTLRESGELIGYAIFLIGHNLHYQSSYQAVQDVIFIVPERRGGPGAKFIAWCDEQLQSLGVQKVVHHVKEDICDFGPLLMSMGYIKTDILYSRRLDR